MHAETDFYWHFVGGRASIDPWLNLDSLNCWEFVLLCAWIANRPVEGRAGRREAISPSTGRSFASYSLLDAEQAGDALRAAREVVGEGNLVVAFQAHHYYRTAMFVEEFGEALGLADHVGVLEVYAPGEEPIPGASGQSMASHVPLPEDRVVFEPSWSAVAGHLAERAEPGDIVMTLGAGDIVLLGPEVLDLLGERFGGAS